jgi:hypothetical protein
MPEIAQAQKLQAIKKLLLGLAAYYEKALTPAQLGMYAEDLEDLELEAIGRAIRNVRRDPSQKFFPLPAVLRALIVGDRRDEALEASNRIVQALSSYGWTNPERARQFIGELGWRVVEREGGWENVCRAVQSYDDLGTLKAQWRELARSILARADSGRGDQAPALPGGSPVARLVDQAIKKIPEEPK